MIEFIHRIRIFVYGAGVVLGDLCITANTLPISSPIMTNIFDQLKGRDMYCKKCGTRNDDTTYRCTHCGESLQRESNYRAPAQDIPNYLVQAILATLFCCMPFGVVAIVFASQVNSKIQAGDIHGAQDASDKAKTWCWVSFGAGAISTILYIILIAAGGGR
jgi:hypothetical protein